MSTTLLKVAEVNLQEILDRTDWNRLWDRVGWAQNMPTCGFHDGGVICGYWRSWILNGRQFYDSSREGEREYIAEIREYNPRITADDVTSILNQNNII